MPIVLMVINILTESAVTIGAIAAILTGLGVIWLKGLKPAWRNLQHAIQSGRQFARQLDWIQAQMVPNGGTTVKDQITRIEKQVQKVENNAEAHWQALEDGTSAIAERVAQNHADLSSRLGIIETHLKLSPPVGEEDKP